MSQANSAKDLDDWNGTGLIVAVSVMLTLSTILLAMRVVARKLTNAERGWDDYLLPVSWLLLVGLAIVLLGM